MIKDKGDIHQAFSPSEGLVDELVIIVGIFVKYAALCRRIGLDGETVLGQGNEAFDLYKRICPAWLEEESEGHETESYVYAQTVTGQASGELGHTKNRWITRTAFWTFLSISQAILDIHPDYNRLRVVPCLPDELKEYTVRRRFRGTEYVIHVRKTDTPSITLDGHFVKGNVIPLI